MALNKLKKWIGTQAMTAFFDQLNDNVDATNAAIDLVESHLAESSKKHIANSGTIGDGHYIKFDDGTMIYYGFFTYTGPCSGAGGALYRTNSGIPLPATPNDFVGDVIRRFSAVPTTSGTDAVVFGIEFQSQAHRADIFTPISHSNITVKIGFEYIGRWK